MDPKTYKDRMLNQNKLAAREWLYEAYDANYGEYPVFTLNRVPEGDLISLPKAYLEHYQDSTEIDFVDHYFHGRLDLWQKIKNLKSVKEEYDQWVEEAGLRRLSEGLKGLIKIAKNDDKQSSTAYKYLCDHALAKETKAKRKAGRPSNADLQKAKLLLLQEDEEVAAAFDRLSTN